MIYLKHFESHTEYEAYTASTSCLFPNTSICDIENDVHYNALIHAESVELNKTTLSIEAETTEELHAMVLPLDAIDRTVTWSSSDNTIATVDSNGVVSGVASGDVTITVTTNDGHHTATCAVNVRPINYNDRYLTLVAMNDNTTIELYNGMNDGEKWCSFDNGNTWQTLTSTEITATINSGQTVLLKALNVNGFQFNVDSHFKAEGNVMSMAYGDDFKGQTSMVGKSFGELFGNNSYSSNLVDITNLKLPATTLVEYCYGSMFNGCGITSIPSGFLPATTVVDHCYESMFRSCTSLITVPSDLLPATALEEQCYINMFNGCSGLQTAPELPATTLADYCYCGMFQDCTSLNYIKCLATDISANGCTWSWVSGVASNGTFVKASSTDWSVKTGADGIPSGWNVQVAS